MLQWEVVQGVRRKMVVGAVEECCSSAAVEVELEPWQTSGATAGVQRECPALVVVAVPARDLGEVEVVLKEDDFQQREEVQRICLLPVYPRRVQVS